MAMDWDPDGRGDNGSTNKHWLIITQGRQLSFDRSHTLDKIMW